MISKNRTGERVFYTKCKLISLVDSEYGREDLCDIENGGVKSDSHSAAFENPDNIKERILALIGGK